MTARGMTAVKFFTFTVEGRGDFPVDMLRYDACWPNMSADAYALTDRGLRAITLRSYALDAARAVPTEARWDSFGWRVTRVAGDRLGAGTSS